LDRLDGLGLLIESPLLSLGLSQVLDINITSSSNDSLQWQSREEVEWFVNLEAHIELGLVFLLILKIKELPLLVSSTILFVRLNISTFFIFASLNFNDSSVFDVGNVATFHPPDHPPFAAGAGDNHLWIVAT
jgi:hypothetical protein